MFGQQIVVGIQPLARPIPYRSEHLDPGGMSRRSVGNFVAPVVATVNADAQQRHAQRPIERVVLGGRKGSAPRAGKTIAVNGLLVSAHVNVALGVSVE